jgi:hypothetical protein
MFKNFHRSILGASPALRAGDRAFRLYLLPPPAPKGYRFNPLRGRKPSAFAFSKPLRGFDFAEFHFVKLPNPNQNAAHFGKFHPSLGRQFPVRKDAPCRSSVPKARMSVRIWGIQRGPHIRADRGRVVSIRCGRECGAAAYVGIAGFFPPSLSIGWQFPVGKNAPCRSSVPKARMSVRIGGIQRGPRIRADRGRVVSIRCGRECGAAAYFGIAGFFPPPSSSTGRQSPVGEDAPCHSSVPKARMSDFLLHPFPAGNALLQ